MSDYPKSEASYKEGIRIAKEAGIENDMAGILYGNLSQIYIEKYKDYDEAIRLLKKAEAIYDATGSSNSKEHLYRNLSEVYRLKIYASKIICVQVGSQSGRNKQPSRKKKCLRYVIPGSV
jgi:predicted kinase